MNRRSKLFLTISILLTFLLCYIDEGYYDFRWMKDWGNWIAFAIYVGVMYAMQELLYKALKHKVAAIILGITLGLILLFWMLG